MPLDALKPISSSSHSKQPAVIEALTVLARKLGPGAKLPTVREISRSLGVTKATLTRGLEQLEARGVLRCLQGSGIYVEAGILQKRIGLVFGENFFSNGSSDFGSLILSRCAKRAEEHNERFSFFLDNPAFHGVMNGMEVPAHQDLADAIKQGKLDGLLLVARASVEQEIWLRGHGIPVVRADSRRDSLPASNDSVIFDYEALVRLGVSRLASKGCRTLGLLGSLREHGSYFLAALREYGLQTRSGWVVHPLTAESSSSNLRAKIGRAMAEDLLALTSGENQGGMNLPDGILITDDVLASGALDFFASRGICIGHEVKSMKVASHSNKGSALLASWESRILRLQFDPDAMAAAMLDCLESRMEGHCSLAPRLIAPSLA